MFAYPRHILLIISASVFLHLQCYCQNLQIIYYNSTYSHSFVNQQNNFGDGNGGSSNSITNNPSNNDQRHETEKPQITPFSPYFGMEFVPYVKSASYPIGDYTNQDVKDMLNIILTKGHSILTLEMGFHDQEYSGGPWDITITSVIATLAAQMNSDHNSKLITVSQGAGVLSKDGPQPDIEAAFYSAQHANSIFPETVWGITLIPNYYDTQTEGYIQISKSGGRVLAQLQQNYRRAHTMNLKLGVFIDQCGDIMGGPLKESLVAMAKTSDYLICSFYPKQPVSDPQDYFNFVTILYHTVRASFQRHAPSLEIILQSGWATHGKSMNNPEYMNSPKKTKQFWELMATWAQEKKVKVFMHEAFDIPKRSGNSSWGYWKWDEDCFIDKVSRQPV